MDLSGREFCPDKGIACDGNEDVSAGRHGRFVLRFVRKCFNRIVSLWMRASGNVFSRYIFRFPGSRRNKIIPYYGVPVSGGGRIAVKV